MNGAHVGKKCLTYGLHVLIKRAPLYLNRNYLVQTKCIMRKNVEGGTVEGKGWGPGAPPPFAPERDATALKGFTMRCNKLV